MNTDDFTSTECSQTFSIQPANDHKQILDQQLDKLIQDYDQLKQSTKSEDNQSIKIIDEWERQSIVKIQQIANDHRQELRTKTEKYKDHLSRRSNDLHEELINARNNNDFMEIDLKNWSNKLAKLKSYIQSPPTVTIQDDPFISKLSIYAFPDDIFETFAGDLRIKNNGQVVIHGPSVAHAVVRGSGEYSTGEHRFRFQIESFNINKWIFFGIISNKVTIQSNTWAIPSSYGWGGQDYTILNCAMHAGLNGYECDFELNDIIELILNCDNQTISLTNQRTKCIYRMSIDIIKCPFPWQFLLNLFYPDDRVRILYESTL
jgi:hypothetical protein